MKTAVVTGASSGIGAASAKALADDGWRVYLGARRLDRLEQVAADCGPNAIPVKLDITDQASVDALASRVGEVHLLVNNAGGAKGLATVEQANLDDWRWMYETNVLGTLRVTKALLPQLVNSGNGMVITIDSIAAYEAYAGGGGYNSAKFAEHALVKVLRYELEGQPVRVTEINPGLVETEFSLVRFDGDAQRAAKVYEGITPLSAQDIGECVRWVAAQPPHVNVDVLTVLARDQVGAVRSKK